MLIPASSFFTSSPPSSSHTFFHLQLCSHFSRISTKGFSLKNFRKRLFFLEKRQFVIGLVTNAGIFIPSKRKNKGIYLPFFKRWLWWNNQLITCQASLCSGKIKFKDLVCIKKWIGSLEANNQCFSRTICFQFILKPFSNWRRIQDGWIECNLFSRRLARFRRSMILRKWRLLWEENA